MAAKANLVDLAEDQPDDLYHELRRRADRAIALLPHPTSSTPGPRHKEAIVAENFKNLATVGEDIRLEFTYQPPQL